MNSNGIISFSFIVVCSFLIIVSGIFDAPCHAQNSSLEKSLIEETTFGNEGNIRDILGEGVDVNAKDSDGWTALMYASMLGNAKIVKLLLENGASLGVKDPDGNTALYMASKTKNPEVLNLLKSPPPLAPVEKRPAGTYKPKKPAVEAVPAKTGIPPAATPTNEAPPATTYQPPAEPPALPVAAEAKPAPVPVQAEPAAPPEEEYDYEGSRSSFTGSHAAELYIDNNSQRHLTLKIMKVMSGSRALKYGPLIKVDPLEKHGPIYFYETGRYYIKAKLEYEGREPVYSKGNPFKVTVGSGGYSVLRITYSLKENSFDPLTGVKISKSDFDANSD